jgi:hypothetical protein
MAPKGVPGGRHEAFGWISLDGLGDASKERRQLGGGRNRALRGVPHANLSGLAGPLHNVGIGGDARHGRLSDQYFGVRAARRSETCSKPGGQGSKSPGGRDRDEEGRGESAQDPSLHSSGVAFASASTTGWRQQPHTRQWQSAPPSPHDARVGGLAHSGSAAIAAWDYGRCLRWWKQALSSLRRVDFGRPTIANSRPTHPRSRSIPPPIRSWVVNDWLPT